MEKGLTFQNILPIILALLLIFIIPMILRRYGMDMEDLLKMIFTRVKKTDYAKAEKKKEPWVTNSRGNELKSLVSTLLIFVRKNKLGLVYPGTVVNKEKMANLVALLVTRREVVGINCFGFGGTIKEDKGSWKQHMNGVDNQIPNPVAGNADQYNIVRAAMDEAGMKDIPLRVMSVFTSRMVTISTSHKRDVFDTEGLLNELSR
ncbi:MAG: hypothetical protein IIZ39_07550, partial [Blautia sp.]|nr:hypothetical protein [Blautia sp.]